MTTYGVMTERWGWQPTARMLGGLPTWTWRCAPAGLLTRRQMRAAGLAPGGAEPVAQVTCKRGRRKAYLYDPAELVPKRTASPAQLQAVAKATKARRWCPTGQHYADYCIPTSLGECVACHYADTAAEHDDDTAGGWDQQTQAHGLVEGELSGQPVDHGDTAGVNTDPARRCASAVDRARVALDCLHEQTRIGRERWAPMPSNADLAAGWQPGDHARTELTEVVA